MIKKRKVFSYVIDDNNTDISTLGVVDQFLVLIKRLFYDEAESLKNISLIAKEEMTLRADFYNFLRKATEKLRKGKRSVTMKLSSNWKKYIYELQNDPKWSKSYDIEIVDQNVEYDIHYYLTVTLRVKSN